LLGICGGFARSSRQQFFETKKIRDGDGDETGPVSSRPRGKILKLRDDAVAGRVRRRSCVTDYQP
jgi:hypothetical protein